MRKAFKFTYREMKVKQQRYTVAHSPEWQKF